MSGWPGHPGRGDDEGDAVTLTPGLERKWNYYCHVTGYRTIQCTIGEVVIINKTVFRHKIMYETVMLRLKIPQILETNDF